MNQLDLTKYNHKKLSLAGMNHDWKIKNMLSTFYVFKYLIGNLFEYYFIQVFEILLQCF